MLPIDLQILKYYLFEKPLYHFKIKPYLSTPAYLELMTQLHQYQPNHELAEIDLEEATYTIFDLETTGFIPEIGHEIISIGAIQVKGFSFCKRDKFYEIIKPMRPIPRNVTELTGIDIDTIHHGKNFIDVFTDFFMYSKDTILVAHPAKFDVRFLQTMLKRWKLPDFQPLVIDSQEIAKWLLPDVSCQLDPMIRYYNLQYLDRHHALNDAIMTAELFEYLLKDVKANNIQSYNELRQVLALQKKKHPYFKI